MSKQYDASSITVLEGLEAVRLRPAMYIGGTGKEGFHHLLWELLDNAVDEAMNGHAKRIDVMATNDPRPNARVRDDGRGIPFDQHSSGRPAVEVIFTTLHAGGKFSGDGYKVAGGLHGVGSSVVCALSESVRVTIHREGAQYEQYFDRGVPREPHTFKSPPRYRGTEVAYAPDVQIFGPQQFDLALIRQRVRAKAYLTPGVVFTLNGEEFCYRGGLADLVAARVVDEQMKAVTEFPFVLVRPDLQVALTWTTDARTADELVSGFANGIPTPDGGTHVLGLKTAVSEVVRDFIREHGLAPKRPQVEAEDVREGLVGAVHVLVQNPQFQGQTKDRLNNPEVRGAVTAEVRKALAQWLLSNAAQSQRLAARVVEAARVRTATRQVVADVRSRKTAGSRLNLPGKLADCSLDDPALTELFIVEGDSAGGSAKQGRDRETQAILPVRGKVLNTVDVSWKKLEANQQLADVIQALGCGFGPEFDLEKLRYGKVILLMDADSDGHHIATLLMAFFYRAMPGLIRAGRLFLACPPLYRVNVGNESTWARDDQELKSVLSRLSKRSLASAEVSYFKGLGEMPPKTLFETTMDPRARRLERVEIPDGVELEVAAMMQDLMGGDVEMRLPHIRAADLRTIDLEG